ncbi:MAG: hypothetical protein V7782_13715 [Psychromonas sp.]
MNKISAILFIFTFTVLNNKEVNAEINNNDDLKTSGRALANYQLCADIATSIKDKSMFLYYNEMYRYSLLESKMLPIWQVQVIFEAQQQSKFKLLKLDRNSFEVLCLSRFDELTRKIYDTKIHAEIKDNANSI